MHIRLGPFLIFVRWNRTRTKTQTGPADPPATRTQRVAGTPPAFAPLVRCGPGGRYRRDLYSVGQVLDQVV